MKYIVFLVVLLLLGIIYEKFNLRKEINEYDYVHKFLLNGNALEKPFLWLHSTKSINSRHWLNFGSRNNKENHEPYKNLNVQSIINKCNNDFNIVHIDDTTFGKIIPNWNIDVDNQPEPLKSRFRELAMARLLKHYGGLIIPASFICFKNLSKLYHQIESIAIDAKNYGIMGCKKGTNYIDQYIKYLEVMSSQDFNVVSQFSNNTIKWFQNNNLQFIDDKLIGLVDIYNKPILIEHLFENSFIDLHQQAYGIILPEKELLKRPKYQWFSRLSENQVLECDNNVGKYIIKALQ